ncbi:hypothetical protein, partial [Streptomyces sp. NPDC057403]|uniref:hypothetical protein n=1 Tax=Streptomyces sp. NPDC057403 TaxID=3346119 RepID=UPI003697BC61
MTTTVLPERSFTAPPFGPLVHRELVVRGGRPFSQDQAAALRLAPVILTGLLSRQRARGREGSRRLARTPPC